MSLILEALKKSEQQRRLGEMPTLSSPAPSRRQRRSALPWLAALVVLALAAAWWLSRDGAPPATVAEAPPMPPAPAPAAAPATEAPAAASPRQRRAPPAAERAPAAPAGADTVHIPDPAPGPDRPGAVVDLPPAGPVASAPTQVPPPATEMSRPASARPARPAQRDAAEPAASPAIPPPSSSPPAPTAAPPQPAAATPAAAAPPAAPALPSVWELPYAVRRDLPAIALTMHVWSSEPAGRFVVIDGERHVEGDELENGVVLREIRADGVVLDFQGHRFTYPRDGR